MLPSIVSCSGDKRALNCIDSTELQCGHDSHQNVKLPAQRLFLYYFKDTQGFCARHCTLLLHNVIDFFLVVSFPPELPGGCRGERGKWIILLGVEYYSFRSGCIKPFGLPVHWCRWWCWCCLCHLVAAGVVGNWKDFVSLFVSIAQLSNVEFTLL